MLPPPGFLKPLWRGWEGSVRTDLDMAVATIKQSLGGCHQEKVKREETNVPSSNQHLYGQKPTRFELLQGNKETTRKRENKGNVQETIELKILCCTVDYNTSQILDHLQSEEMRVQMSMQFVAKCNPFARQKAGGQKTAPSIPTVIAQTMSCLMCVTKAQCLGRSCLGDNGKYS